LGSLSSSYLAPTSGEAVLIDGSDSVPTDYEVNTGLIFGDYFFTEALLRLQDRLEGEPGWRLYDWKGLASELSAASPVPSIWAVMLLGFAGLGSGGFRARRRRSVAQRPEDMRRSILSCAPRG
jgi:hypothetical protein